MTEQEQKAFDLMREALNSLCKLALSGESVLWTAEYDAARRAITAANAVSDIHASDCAVHNEPAYPNGPCNCDAASAVQPQAQGEVFNEFFHFGPFIDAAGIRADDKAHVVVNKLQSAIQQHFSANAAHPQATEPAQAAFARLDKCEGKPDGTCDKCGGSCMWFGKPAAPEAHHE